MQVLSGAFKIVITHKNDFFSSPESTIFKASTSTTKYFEILPRVMVSWSSSFVNKFESYFPRDLEEDTHNSCCFRMSLQSEIELSGSDSEKVYLHVAENPQRCSCAKFTIFID